MDVRLTTTKPGAGPRRRTMARVALAIGLFWGVLAGGAVLYAWISDFPDAANLLVYDPGSDVTLVDVEGRTIARRGNNQGQIVDARFAAAPMSAMPSSRSRTGASAIISASTCGALAAPWSRTSPLAASSRAARHISQQLAKNLFLKPERTIKRKVDEAILALYLEYRYTKDEILTLYLNRVYFGGGVYGIEAAAERFFNKPASELSLTEAAMLAGSVKAPSRYNPDASPDAAMARAGLVLSAMAEQGFIGDAQRAKGADDQAQDRDPHGHARARDISSTMRCRSSPRFAGKAKERLIVDTTLDLDLQAEAERALDAGLAKDGKALAATQGALVSMTLDGAVRALVGGRELRRKPVQSRRSTQSASRARPSSRSCISRRSRTATGPATKCSTDRSRSAPGNRRITRAPTRARSRSRMPWRAPPIPRPCS